MSADDVDAIIKLGYVIVILLGSIGIIAAIVMAILKVLQNASPVVLIGGLVLLAIGIIAIS